MVDDLERFVTAQAPQWASIEEELRAGRKRTHWMWFVFPQLRGLGRSEMAHRYGLASLAQARAYLAHPVLGARLQASVEWLLATQGRSAHDIFGSPDDLKLRSCLTLFGQAQGGEGVFSQALDKFFDGQADAATLRLLGKQSQD
jgi:uncharacterized protein (DUF1810 family)